MAFLAFIVQLPYMIWNLLILEQHSIVLQTKKFSKTLLINAIIKISLLKEPTLTLYTRLEYMDLGSLKISKQTAVKFCIVSHF